MVFLGIRSRYETLERHDVELRVLVLKKKNKVADYVIVCNRCKKRFVVDKSLSFDVAVEFLINSLRNHCCARRGVENEM